MNHSKKSTKKGGTKGKAEGSKKVRRPSVKERARAIITDETYFADTRHAIQNALDEGTSDLAELVRRAEMGEHILDARGTGGNAERSARPTSHAAMCDTTAHNLDTLVEASGFEFITDMVVDAITEASARLDIEEPRAWYDGEPREDKDQGVKALALWLGNIPKTFSLRRTEEGITLTTTLSAETCRGEFGSTLEEMERYRRYGEYFARLLEHDETPHYFELAFDALFSDFYSEEAGVRLTLPALLRVLYPLTMAAAGSESAHRFEQTCIVLTEALLPEALRESQRAGVFGSVEKGGTK